MKYTKTLLSTAAVALLATGCVKPTKEDKNPVVYDNSQPVYEEPAPIIYESAGTSQSGVIYTDAPVDNTIITTDGTYTQPASGTYTQPANGTYTQPANGTYTQPASTAGTQVYTNPYETAPATNYPDPYANGGAATSYPVATNNYPAASTPAPAGGIHLQIAALKDYYAATEFKNTLTLAPGQSAYVKRGAMNKVIVTGISSMQEANQLKETRFPGSFIVQGSGGGYTPPVTPAYDTGAYTVNNSYGSGSSHAASSNGIGVQIGAFSRRAQAQDVADSQRGQYSPIIKKIGKYYKVILTGFSNRAAAKSALSSGKIPNGFVVSY